MLNRLSHFGKGCIFFSSFSIGAYFDKQINLGNSFPGVDYIYIWVIPSITLVTLLLIHFFKVFSKYILFILPLSLWVLTSALLLFTFYGNEGMYIGAYLILIGGGAILGSFYGFLFTFFIDRKENETEIQHLWMLILGFLFSAVFYCLYEIYNLQYFDLKIIILQVIANAIGIILEILFLIKNRHVSSILRWKIFAIYAILLSLSSLLGGISNYQSYNLPLILPQAEMMS